MRSFRNRLLVLIIGLIVVTQTVTLISVLTSARRAVEARAAEQLAAGAEFAHQLIEFRARQLASAVAVLAADFGFREAVAYRDSATILSAASNHAHRIDADLMLVMDIDGELLASTEPVDRPEFEPLVDRVLGNPEVPHFAMFSGRLHQFFVAPIRAPETIGWAAMGFVVDDALARRIGSLVDVETSFVVADGAATLVAASTLESALRRPAVAAVAFDVAAAGRTMTRRLGNEDYLTHVLELEPGNANVRLALYKSERRTLEPYRQVRNSMLGLGGTALLLAILIATLLERSAIRPIDRLVRAARRIEDGSYDEPIRLKGAEEFQRLAGTLNAMQQRVAEREVRIRQHAYQDALTGLPTRTRAEEELAWMLDATTSESCVTVMLIDLANLRSLNASLGHRVGDEMLRALAQRLVRACHPCDRAARLGASRFLVLLCRPHGVEEAPALAAGLLDGVRGDQRIGNIEVGPELKAGFCTSPVDGSEPDQLIRRAEIALNDAEQARERIRRYEAGSDEEHLRRLELISELQHAIDADGLSVVFQPKVSMTTRQVIGAEALLRWVHPRLGPVSPAEFVPLAEQTGHSRELTDWVLRAAIRQMAAWRGEGVELDVAVNLSAGDIVDDGLSDTVLGLLAELRVPATSLVLEITESAAMRDPVAAARNMELLRVAGIRFAVDDFGTGYSSLSQLSRLPVDELKIDRSFVSRATSSVEDASIVRSTIELGHSLNLRVVAEGVEDTETWSLLRRDGCDLAQGYLISKPLPPAELPAYVLQANAALGSDEPTLVQFRSLGELLARRG